MISSVSTFLLGFLLAGVAASPQQQLWPTPLYTVAHAHGTLARALRQPLLSLAGVDEGVQKSNKESNGWHSSELLRFGLHQKLGSTSALESASAVLALHDAVVRATRSMIVRTLSDAIVCLHVW